MTEIIGEARPAYKIKRGWHVRLADGREGLAMQDAARGDRWVGFGVRVADGTIVAVALRAYDDVFTRTPAEQIRQAGIDIRVWAAKAVTR